MFFVRLRWLAALSALLGSCTDAGRCAIGTEGCICTELDTCNDGSSCSEGMCVAGAAIDSGMDGSVEPPDGGREDSGGEDGGRDSGPDSGEEDSGPPVDGGEDAGEADAGDGDAGGADAGDHDSGPTHCNVGDCDDDLACTADSCNALGMCVNEPRDEDEDGYPELGCLTGTDCNDDAPSTHPGAAEVCDGLDNDCDMMADNGAGMECVRGSGATSCMTSCGTNGTRSCTNACTFTRCVATEVCNGCDDDGMGGPDDTFMCVMGETTPCMVGSCPGTASCDASCTPGACMLGAPSANDTCLGAPRIVASGSYPFSTCAAANDYSASCGGSTGADVVFQLDIAVTSDVVIQTDATFDSVLHLRSAGCPGTATACNDTGPSIGTNARIAMMLTPGTYFIVVDGKTPTAVGTGTLDVTMTERIGNECTAALPITLSPGRTVVSGSTIGATHSTDTCGTAPDVWYSFTLTRAEVVYIHTFGSTYDTMIGMRDFACATPTANCDDDSVYCAGLQSSILRALDPGTYYISVDGFQSAAGTFTLTIEHLPLGNTLSATELAVGASTVMSTTTGTGLLSDCRSGTAPEDTYFWVQCPTSPGGTFDADTCDAATTLDTVLYVWSGETGGRLACNDDDTVACALPLGPSVLSSPIPAGAGLFTVYVDGYLGGAGPYTAHFTRPPL